MAVGTLLDLPVMSALIHPMSSEQHRGHNRDNVLDAKRDVVLHLLDRHKAVKEYRNVREVVVDGRSKEDDIASVYRTRA